MTKKVYTSAMKVKQIGYAYISRRCLVTRIEMIRIKEVELEPENIMRDVYSTENVYYILLHFL